MTGRGRKAIVAGLLASVVAGWAIAQEPAEQPATTAPTTIPADEYDRLLGNEAEVRERPLLPQNSATIDRSTGHGSIAPGAPSIQTRREGSFVDRRLGRLVRSPDGQGWEFVFLADGTALQDPPLKVLPNLKLQTIEDELAAASRDLTLRISGTLTEYRGRNHVLLEMVVVVRDPT